MVQRAGRFGISSHDAVMSIRDMPDAENSGFAKQFDGALSNDWIAVESVNLFGQGQESSGSLE